MSLRCGHGHRNQPKYKTQQKPAGAEAQVHSERGGGCKHKASVLPPLTMSVARDRSRVDEMLLQNSLLINAKGRGLYKGRLQTNEKGRGLKGALRGGGGEGAGNPGRDSSAFFSNPCDHLTHFSEAHKGECIPYTINTHQAKYYIIWHFKRIMGFFLHKTFSHELLLRLLKKYWGDSSTGGKDSDLHQTSHILSCERHWVTAVTACACASFPRKAPSEIKPKSEVRLLSPRRSHWLVTARS